MIQMMKVKKTIAERINEYGAKVRPVLIPLFEKSGIAYPPKSIILLGLKSEALLEVWVSDDAKVFKKLISYPILKLSGKLGPKLFEGDLQVPEGIYRIESLNPNSFYHLALRVNYPNDYDLEKARLEGRKNLGSDIMIHGGMRSVGCLAMGDEAIEELFLLAAETGIERIQVILSPFDMRLKGLSDEESSVPWRRELYQRIKQEIENLV